MYELNFELVHERYELAQHCSPHTCTNSEFPPSSHCSNCIALILRDLGRLEKESLQKLAEVAKEGFLLKQQLIHEAKKGQEEKQVRKANQGTILSSTCMSFL